MFHLHFNPVTVISHSANNVFGFGRQHCRWWNLDKYVDTGVFWWKLQCLQRNKWSSLSLFKNIIICGTNRRMYYNFMFLREEENAFNLLFDISVTVINKTELTNSLWLNDTNNQCLRWMRCIQHNTKVQSYPYFTLKVSHVSQLQCF